MDDTRIDNNQELWNEICFILSENIKPDISETQFQREVVRALEKLGWRQFKKEIIEKISMPSGTSSIEADVIVQSPENSVPFFVIEIKAPNVDSTNKKIAAQLLSYMRQSKCEIGIIIGNMISIIWDDRQSTQTDYLLLDQFPFVPENNTDGIEFINVFSKSGVMEYNSIQGYIQKKVHSIQQNIAYSEEKKRITSKVYCEKIKEYIKNDIESNLSKELADKLINEISVSISSKDPQPILNDSVHSHSVNSNKIRTATKPNSFDFTQYTLDGVTYGKGRLALAIVKKYIKENPNTSFHKLENIFPKYLQGSAGVFKKLEDALEIINRDKKRHFVKPDEVIKLTDSTVAVSTEWGVGNIGKLLKAANSMKYEIKAIE